MEVPYDIRSRLPRQRHLFRGMHIKVRDDFRSIFNYIF